MAETKTLAPKASIFAGIMSSIISLLVAFGVGAAFIAAAGLNPLAAYGALLDGAFGSPYRIAETLVAATPLTLMALGTIIAFKASMFNIGGVGQEHIGAILSTWIGAYFIFPSYIHIPLVILMGFIGGALWALPAAILKAKYGISEIVVTVMLNYVATFLIGYLVSGPMLEPGSYIPWTPQLQPSARLPTLVGRLHWDFLIALISIPLIYVFLSKTVLGYKLRAVGENPKAARFAGINITRSAIISMFISGGLIGVAGMGEIAGVFLRVQEGFSPGYGYTCIPVALLAKLNPLAALPAAVIFGALYSGGLTMKAITGVPQAITEVIQGVVMVLLIVSEVVTRWRK